MKIEVDGVMSDCEWVRKRLEEFVRCSLHEDPSRSRQSQGADGEGSAGQHSEDELTRADHSRVEAHLESCRECEAVFEHEEAFLSTLTEGLSIQRSLRPDLKERILRQLLDEGIAVEESQQLEPTPAPRAAAAPRKRVAGEVSGPRIRRLVAALAAAVALIAVPLIGYRLLSPADRDTAPVTVADPTRPGEDGLDSTPGLDRDSEPAPDGFRDPDRSGSESSEAGDPGTERVTPGRNALIESYEALRDGTVMARENLLKGLPGSQTGEFSEQEVALLMEVIRDPEDVARRTAMKQLQGYEGGRSQELVDQVGSEIAGDPAAELDTGDQQFLLAFLRSRAVRNADPLPGAIRDLIRLTTHASLRNEGAVMLMDRGDPEGMSLFLTILTNELAEGLLAWNYVFSGQVEIPMDELEVRISDVLRHAPKPGVRKRAIQVFLRLLPPEEAIARVLDIVGDDLTLGDELLRSLLRERKPEFASVPASPRLVRYFVDRIRRAGAGSLERVVKVVARFDTVSQDPQVQSALRDRSSGDLTLQEEIWVLAARSHAEGAALRAEYERTFPPVVRGQDPEAARSALLALAVSDGRALGAESIVDMLRDVARRDAAEPSFVVAAIRALSRVESPELVSRIERDLLSFSRDHSQWWGRFAASVVSRDLAPADADASLVMALGAPDRPGAFETRLAKNSFQAWSNLTEIVARRLSPGEIDLGAYRFILYAFDQE